MDPLKLIDAYFDGLLTDQESAQLSAWIKASPENAKIFAQQSFLERRMRDITVGEYVSDQLLAEVCSPAEAAELAEPDFAATGLNEAGANDESTRRVLVQTAPQQTTHRLSRRRLGMWLGSSLAVMLMGVFYAWGNLASDPNAETVQEKAAMLAYADSVEWDEEYGKFEIGDRLGPDVICFRSGSIRLDYGNGTIVSLRGPARFEVISAQRCLLRSGQVTVNSPLGAVGFQVYTTNVSATDVVGGRFGIEFNEEGEANVLVFDGAVHVDCFDALSPGTPAQTKVRLSAAEGVRVGFDGSATRVQTVFGDPLDGDWSVVPPEDGSSIFQGVRDDYQGERGRFYRVVPGGFQEDAPAYVNHYHEWNGLADGIPAELTGADYVLPFYIRDMANHHLRVKLGQPAKLFVLHDDSAGVPEWLSRDFERMESSVGMDQLKRKSPGTPLLGVGAGQSIDAQFSVWRRTISRPQEVMLGPMTEQAYQLDKPMYGVVAAPAGEAAKEGG